MGIRDGCKQYLRNYVVYDMITEIRLRWLKPNGNRLKVPVGLNFAGPDGDLQLVAVRL